MINEETDLCKIAFKYKTDKCFRYRKIHTYTPYYYSLFKNKKNTINKVLEIGIGKGGSLYMWREFFPNAQIYGVDYRKECLIKDDRIESLLLDQRRKAHLMTLIDKVGSDIDIVIDDGSHRPRDQAYTCLNLMPLLQKDIIYIIEDVADPSIAKRFKDYDVEVPKIYPTTRYDNCLIVVRHHQSL